jgi:hypothetical protein
LKQYFDLRNAKERAIYDFVCLMRLCELDSEDEHLAKRSFFVKIGAMLETDVYKDMLSFEDDYWKLLDRMTARVWERRCPQGHECPLRLDARLFRVASGTLVENCEQMTELLHMSAEKFAYLRDNCPHMVDAKKCGEPLTFTGQFERGVPLFVPFIVHNSLKQNFIRKHVLPFYMRFFEHEYNLCGVVIFDTDCKTFHSYLCVDGKWFWYDNSSAGMFEVDFLKHVLLSTYIINSVLYIYDSVSLTHNCCVLEGSFAKYVDRSQVQVCCGVGAAVIFN